MRAKNLILSIVLVAVAASPFIYYGARAKEFTGTDDQAETVIRQTRPEFTPWIHSLFEPNETIEKILFGAQALGGAGLLGYSLLRIRRRNRERRWDAPQTR